MNLQRLLLIQAGLTFSTFITLVVAPATIPAFFGIQLAPDQYLLCYLLAVSELGLAYLSLALRANKDIQTRRIVSQFFMVFHGATGLFAGYVFLQGGSSQLLGNAAFRLILVGLFYYYGLTRSEKFTLNRATGITQSKR